MAGKRDRLKAAGDVVLNRLLGTYRGFTPRRPHALIIPRFVAIEREARPFLDVLAPHVRLRALRRSVVLADETTWEIAGRRLYEELQAARLAPRRVIVASNAYTEVAAAVREMSRPPRFWSNDPTPASRRLFAGKRGSLVFAVGGGSVLDVGKLVAYQLHVPCVTVPTSLANDGIASPFSVINPDHDPEAPAQITLPTNTPLGVIVQLTNFGVPGDPFTKSMIRSGIGDIVSNVAAGMDWELAAAEGHESIDYAALLQARSAGESVLHRLAHGADVTGERFLLALSAALVASGEAMTRVGSSRPASGFEHKLYHAYRNLLRIPTRASHGVLVAVGTRVAAEAHGRQQEVLRAAFERAGLPVDRAGLAAEDLDPAALERAIRASVEIKPQRFTILEHLGAEALVEAFRVAFPP